MDWLSNNPDTFTYAVGLELRFIDSPKPNIRTKNVSVSSSGQSGHINFKPSLKLKLYLIWKVIWS